MTSDKIQHQQEDIRFRILRLLQEDPNYSQRDIAKALGVSLGGVNYCLNALAKKGHIKIRNFKKSNDKRKYVYLLTPKGIAEKTALTRRFLQRKMREYEAFKAEIEAVREDIELGVHEKLRGESTRLSVK